VAGRNWIIAIVAILLGLVAVIIANAWFSGMEDKQETNLTANTVTKIVVATQPLEFGTKLTPQNIRLQDWPAASVPQGAYRTIQEALRGDRAALRPIVVGEPVLADKVSGPGGRATLAALLPEGMRAFSVSVDAVRGVAGFVLPGTMVDVILTRKIPGDGTTSEDFRSDILLTNVQVMAIDQVSSDKLDKPKVGRTATLAVTLLDAQRLILAEKMGTLSLALRKVETAAGAANPNLAIAESGGATLTGRQIGGPRMFIGKRNRGESGGGEPQERFMRATPMAPAAMPAPINGPTMTVFRGAEPTVYPVGPSGGR
jgi:pilus assembly protein CpaB